MQVIDTFGKYIEKLSDTNPRGGQRLLRVGWEAQSLKLKFAPEKKLLPADQYLTWLMMQTMLKPLKAPQDSVIVSVFTPCELMQEVGLHPFSVESFSSYLSGSHAERELLQQTENVGLPETLCSYHKVFLGAADKNILPRPRCIVYTNLICDANLLTFRRLTEQYKVPSFFIDVPLEQNEENVRYVADQLRELAVFLKEQTGKDIDEDSLKERIRCSQRTLETFRRSQAARTGRYVPNDLATPMYSGLTDNLLLGTPEEEKYARMILHDIENSPEKDVKRIYWMHTIPFWSDAVRKELCFNDKVQIAGCELSQVFDQDMDPEKPYEAMAMRMVYNTYNGPALRRIEAGIRHTRQSGSVAAIWFDHWGCKNTLGRAQLAKKKFEEQGIPLLILDGDGCDRSRGGEGQTATRLGAFLEMLEEGSHE